MSIPETRITLHTEPKPFSLERVKAAPVSGLLVSGIVNPFGPTINAIVAVGALKVGSRLPLVRLMLNPFQQEIEEVGTLAFGRTWRPSAVIPQLFELRVGSCPSLLLPLEQLKPASAIAVFAEYLRGFDDAREVYDRVRAYYGNPWDRVSREMSTATEKLTAPTPGDAASQEPLTEDEARQLAELLLADEHSSPEVQSLFYAWKGSIQHIGSSALASLPVDQFTAVLEHICSACHVPSAPTPAPTQSPEEMMATVEQLQREGRMPSLDQLMAALQGAIEKEEQPTKKRMKK